MITIEEVSKSIEELEEENERLRQENEQLNNRLKGYKDSMPGANLAFFLLGFTLPSMFVAYLLWR